MTKGYLRSILQTIYRYFVIYFRLKKMVGRCVLCACRCIFDDLFKKGIDFCIVFDFNQCFDQCYCKSGKVHGFGNLHCVKHFKLLSGLFSHYAARKAHCVKRLCCNPCNKCLQYYLRFFNCETFKICISSAFVNDQYKNFEKYDRFDVLNFFRNKNDC